jgi:hypothetical protein
MKSACNMIIPTFLPAPNLLHVMLLPKPVWEAATAMELATVEPKMQVIAPLIVQKSSRSLQQQTELLVSREIWSTSTERQLFKSLPLAS